MACLIDASGNNIIWNNVTIDDDPINIMQIPDDNLPKLNFDILGTELFSFEVSVNHCYLSPFMPCHLRIEDFPKADDIEGYYYVEDVNGGAYIISEELLRILLDSYNNDVNIIRTRIMDYEWDIAMKADERPIYYFVEMSNGGRCVKRYKPSVAGLVMRRTGLKMIPVKGEYKV